jgi:hypothetical protein
MELSGFIVPTLCVLSPFALGWIVLSIIAGIRGGFEGGIRLFLLGLDVLVAFLAIVAILLYSPDWLAITLMLVEAFLPWISISQYLVNVQLSGKLLMVFPSKSEKWSISIASGVALAIFGLSLLIFNDPLITSLKSYVLGLLCISFGVFRTLKRIRYSQIREKGILHEFGGFYRWENIETYSWKFGEDKLTLRLKKSLLKRDVDLKLPSRSRQEAIAYLSQNVDHAANNA